MPENIRGNEATVALVLINACAAFAILAAYGPDNTRPTVLMVATLMGMGALYPIFRLLQRPIRYKIVKEKTEDKETYVLRYKGYLWWYDGKDKNGNRLTFQNINEAFNFIRSNITTMLINERIRRKQRQKAKKEYETVLDSQSDALANLQNEMTAAGNAESENKQDITDKEDEKRSESATAQQEMPKDNNASLDLFKKQVASTNQNLSEKEAENQNPTGNDDESEGKNEEEEEDEKPLGEITGDQTPNSPQDQKIHPAEELSRTFNAFDLEKKPKGNHKNNNHADAPKTDENPQTHEDSKTTESPQTQPPDNGDENAQRGTAQPTRQNDGQPESDTQGGQKEEPTPLTLSNENPIQRFGPKMVTDVISQYLFHNQKRKEREEKSKPQGDMDGEKNKTPTVHDDQETVSNSHDSRQGEIQQIVPKNKRRKKSTDDGWVGKMKQKTIFEELQQRESEMQKEMEKEGDSQPPEAETPSSGGQKVAKRLEDVPPPKQEKTPANAPNVEPPKTDDLQQVFTPGSETNTKGPNDNNGNAPVNSSADGIDQQKQMRDDNNGNAPVTSPDDKGETPNNVPDDSENNKECANSQTMVDSNPNIETEDDTDDRDQEVDVWDTNYSPV